MNNRRTIDTNQAVVSCSVCGRTLLPGEQSEVFIAGGARRHVCELCVPRAVNMGWIRGEAAVGGAEAGAEDRRGPLLSRLRARRAAPGEPPPHGDALLEGAPGEGLPTPRHVHAVPTSAEMKGARALEVFNLSEHPRTVAGVARSLGAPAVTVRPDADRASVVTIVVAWELCWYRYEVDLSEGDEGIRLEGQGYELSELPPEDQDPNAAADEHGALELVDV